MILHSIVFPMKSPVRPERIARLAPRERILDAAEDLFFREGISRVTIEAIAAQAASTKMTVYRHFESKEVLVVTWLQLLVDYYTAALDEIARQQPTDARAQLLAIAKFIAADLSTAGYRGCPFVNSLAELPDETHPARQLIENHKRNQFKRLAQLCTEANLVEPLEVAQELTYLLEGAQVVAQNKTFPDVAKKLLLMVRRRLTTASCS